MRARSLLILALALLGASIAAGVAGAQQQPGDLTVATQALPECSNTVDDDGDQLTDLDDPDCTDPTDTTEATDPESSPPLTTTVPPTTTTPAEPEPSPGPGADIPADHPGDQGTAGHLGQGGVRSGNVDVPGLHKPGNADGRRHRGDHSDADTDTGGTRAPMDPTADRNPDGTPTDTNPSLTIADFGPAPIGVPNFVIDSFAIPPFLLPIYEACGTEYGIPWQVLASINRIETAFGTNLNVSTAGALGWMQFMP
ncbi:MAG: hypothetical protein QOI10_3003, partial [Solirubrobacterales bacterium]|nr:hypothetical protein [Solirubrobacterales bacterium]